MPPYRQGGKIRSAPAPAARIGGNRSALKLLKDRHRSLGEPAGVTPLQQAKAALPAPEEDSCGERIAIKELFRNGLKFACRDFNPGLAAVNILSASRQEKLKQASRATGHGPLLWHHVRRALAAAIRSPRC